MKWIAGALLIGVALRHFSTAWLAPVLDVRGPWLFYLLGALWEVVLCVVLILLLLKQEKSDYRWLAIFAMWVGVAEGLQMLICRMALPNLSAMPSSMNTCDFATGFPVTLVMCVMYVLILCWEARRK